MANQPQWNNFAAFGGTLTPAMLASPYLPGPLQGPDVKTAASNFRNWIAAVRNNPAAHGFANNYVQAVQDLVDEFYPAGRRPRRFRTGVPAGAPGQLVIQPFMVPFGGPGQQLGIADGPSALGYLFSVVAPPANVALTWQDYFLPLTVCYCWCLYLTYIHFEPLVDLDIEAVPKMACVMYLPRENATPFFFLGHTKATATNNDAEWARDRDDNLLCLHYRAGLIQAAAREPLPDTGQVRASMEPTLFEFLAGSMVTNPLVDDFLEPVFSQFANIPDGSTQLAQVQQYLVGLIATEYQSNQTPMPWIPRNNVASTQRRHRPLTQAAMNTALTDLVTDYLTNNAVNPQLYLVLLKEYITPMILVPRNMPVPPNFIPGNLVQIPPGVQITIDALVNAFWLLHQQALEIKLVKAVRLCRGIRDDTLVNAADIALERKWIDKCRKEFVHKDYGRCAETYCAYTVSAVFHPGAFVTANDGPNVRGFALETQVVGVGAAERNMFSGGFNSTALDAISVSQNKSVYREPCGEFCRPMLEDVQMRDTPVKRAAYDDDLNAVQPKSIPVW
ncbi:hypothetical protein F5Y19DRAFT_443164 [Xylariaceae sp. FL1651]|nr:hypothetical protein F5Y19DRAFT_443164 [Xylariaceae sp. FL1651]